MDDALRPEHSKRSFYCPHCGNAAQQHWAWVLRGTELMHFAGGAKHFDISKHSIAKCAICFKPSIWLKHEEKDATGEPVDVYTMVYPAATLATVPTDGMPETVRSLYEEARLISGQSPRAACALLRVALEHLTLELNAEGKTLDARIGSLVKRGLPANVQKACDATRVCGNEAVHPEQLVLEDTEVQARILFWCVNYVTETLITGQGRLEKLYSAIPESKRKAVEKRDAAKP
jgi:hypothetical protein